MISPKKIYIGDLVELSAFSRWSTKKRNDFSKSSREFLYEGGWFLVIEKEPTNIPNNYYFTLFNIQTNNWDKEMFRKIVEPGDPLILNHIKGHK